MSDRSSLMGDALPPWWLELLAGIAWLLVGLIVLRFDYRSVTAVALLFGFVALAAGALEILAAVVTHGWWRFLNIVLAIIFIAAGIVSFIHPGDTFAALAGVFSFFLVFAGAFDIVQALYARRAMKNWWLQLIGGIIEVGLGIWAAGYWGRSATLLIAWVAAFAIIRGIRDLTFSFEVRELQHPHHTGTGTGTAT